MNARSIFLYRNIANYFNGLTAEIFLTVRNTGAVHKTDHALVSCKFFKDYIACDAEGYIIVDGASTQCFQCESAKKGEYKKMPGVFAAGDCADPHYRQAIVAAGSGAKAAIEADKYIKSL
jgi:thioredoxin reductase